MNFTNAPGLYSSGGNANTPPASFLNTATYGIIKHPSQAAGYGSLFRTPTWTGLEFMTPVVNTGSNGLTTAGNTLAHSVDGTTWTYTTPASLAMNTYTIINTGTDSAGANRKIVLTSSTGSVESVDDGATWATSLSPGPNTFNKATKTWMTTYTGSTGALSISTSSNNLASWTTSLTNRLSLASNVPVINQTTGVMITACAVLTGYTGLRYERSTDGITWTVQSFFNGMTSFVNVYAAGPSFFMWKFSTAADGCYLSQDGINWTLTNLPTLVTVTGTTSYQANNFWYANGSYICNFRYYDSSVGGDLATGRYMKSTDGVNWTGPYTLPLTTTYYSWSRSVTSDWRILLTTIAGSNINNVISLK